MAAAVLGLACGGGGSSSHSGPGLTAYVTGVTSSDGSIAAVHRTGALPAAAIRMASQQPAAAAQVAANPKKSHASLASAGYAAAYLPGGTAALGVDATASRVIVAIVGIDGYWELSGLTPTTGQTVLVTFGQGAPTTFTISLGVGDATHITGYTEVPVTLTQVGTGDVQVNVTWDLDVDVDLHVLDPSGEEIYYGNTTSASGGSLDLDSNAACSLDHVRAENITWPAGQAPAGTYKVLVDYFEACIPWHGELRRHRQREGPQPADVRQDLHRGGRRRRRHLLHLERHAVRDADHHLYRALTKAFAARETPPAACAAGGAFGEQAEVYGMDGGTDPRPAPLVR